MEEPMSEQSGEKRKYPNMAPIFSAIQDREKHRELLLAVIEAAKADRAAENAPYKTVNECGDAMIKSRAEFRKAVDALLEFEQKQTPRD